EEMMCAYDRVEGEPCCGSYELLRQVLRESRGNEGLVVAACGAIRALYGTGAHETHPDAASASAYAVLAGTDLDCGSSYKALVESVQKGYIKEEDIDVSVRRLLLARFQLGELDDQDAVSWTKIPYDVVASEAHDEL